MRYYIDPFGCVKNQVDAEMIMSLLDSARWTRTENPETADVIIINSCGFVESAKQESINAVLAHKKNYPDKKIVLAGCLAQRYAEELSEALPEVDLFFGNRDISHVNSALSSVFEKNIHVKKTLVSNTISEIDFISGKRPLLSLAGSAYVKISEGCNNRCSFCAIPQIRGQLVSRPISGIVAECKDLLNRGIKELCIIGQDLGSYLKDKNNNECALTELLSELSKLEGQFWVRLLYIHPDNFPFSVLEVMKSDSRFLPYFDLPFQHGSEKILRAMNRKGNSASYLELIERIRSVLPDVVLRSTFLVGFPGETDEDFQSLLDFQEKARLDWAGAFTYSREENTVAYSMKGRVSKSVAQKRKETIEEKQSVITEKQIERFIGRTLDVLIEESVVNEDGLYLGRLFCHAPEIDGSALIFSSDNLELGSFESCKVLARSGLDLQVKVVKQQRTIDLYSQ